MNETNGPDITDEIISYECLLIRQVAKRLEGQFATGVALLLDQPGDEVRIALAVTLKRDDKGGMIAPELAVRRTETAQKFSMTPFMIGQLDLFEGGNE